MIVLFRVVAAVVIAVVIAVITVVVGVVAVVIVAVAIVAIADLPVRRYQSCTYVIKKNNKLYLCCECTVCLCS